VGERPPPPTPGGREAGRPGGREAGARLALRRGGSRHARAGAGSPTSPDPITDGPANLPDRAGRLKRWMLEPIATEGQRRTIGSTELVGHLSSHIGFMPLPV
jgi:hypothetical protein